MGGLADKKLFGLVHDYLMVYLTKQKCCSPHTIKSYRTSLVLLFNFIKEKNKIGLADITFDMLTRQNISAYLEWLEAEKGCSIQTRNQRLTCIRSFFQYAASMEVTVTVYLSELCKIPLKKTAIPTLVDYMSENAVIALLEQPNTTVSKGIRDQFMMILMYDTGARVQEIIDLKLRDFRLGGTSTVTLFGKGSKIRTVPLMKKTVGYLQSYLSLFHPDEDQYSKEYLFYVVRKGLKEQMSDDNIRKFMREYGRKAQQVCNEVPDNVHPHLWRHTRAMHLYQHGMDLTLISQWLGHAHLETTLIYSHADTEQKRKAIEQASLTCNPIEKAKQNERFVVSDEETLKRLYGLK